MTRHFFVIYLVAVLGCLTLNAKEAEQVSIDIEKLITDSLALSSFEEQPSGIYSDQWVESSETVNLPTNDLSAILLNSH